MSQSSPITDTIVVPVSEDGYDAALRFAVLEARRTARGVDLVHTLMLPPGPYPDVWLDVAATARTMLDGAAETARELGEGEVEVTSTIIEHGTLVGSLVESVDAGSLGVLQHRSFGPLHRILTRSIVNGVAGRARVPVVAVPEGWEPRGVADSVVVVAVQDPAESLPMVRAAAQAAHERGGRLVVMHAWWLANGYAAAVVGPELRDDWAARARTQLEPMVAAVQRDFPDVPITLEVRHGPAAAVLLEAAVHCDLMVLGRRHHLLPFGTHLGPVARAMVDRSPCPVMLAAEPERVD